MPKKHMRLPNGFGQISFLKGRNLRNPYRAMVTVGKRDDGRPICKLLKPQAYFKTYNEAYRALMDYNANPYDLNENITVLELFDRWYDEFLKGDPSESSKRNITSSWKYASSIYGMLVRDVRSRHIKGCIDDSFVEKKGVFQKSSPGIKMLLKTTFNRIFDYAVEYELTDKNYARSFELSENIKKERKLKTVNHTSIDEAVISRLWENTDDYWVDLILVQCYTGWRPQELCLLERKNISLEDWTMTGGMKTSNGTNRVVPIHCCIKEIVKKIYELSEMRGCERLLCSNDGTPIEYFRYRIEFERTCENIGLANYKPHDARKTFITLAKKYDVNEYAIKRIVGHAISDLTERVYTDRNINWLKSEIEKIQC